MNGGAFAEGSENGILKTKGLWTKGWGGLVITEQFWRASLINAELIL